MRKTAAMQHFVVTGWPVARLNSGPDGHYSELLENAKPCHYSLQNNSLLHCINMHTTQNPPLCSDEGLMIETSASQTDYTSWIYFINLIKSTHLHTDAEQQFLLKFTFSHGIWICQCQTLLTIGYNYIFTIYWLALESINQPRYDMAEQKVFASHCCSFCFMQCIRTHYKSLWCPWFIYYPIWFSNFPPKKTLKKVHHTCNPKGYRVFYVRAITDIYSYQEHNQWCHW